MLINDKTEGYFHDISVVFSAGKSVVHDRYLDSKSGNVFPSFFSTIDICHWLIFNLIPRILRTIKTLNKAQPKHRTDSNQCTAMNFPQQKKIDQESISFVNHWMWSPNSPNSTYWEIEFSRFKMKAWLKLIYELKTLPCLYCVLNSKSETIAENVILFLIIVTINDAAIDSEKIMCFLLTKVTLLFRHTRWGNDERESIRFQC